MATLGIARVPDILNKMRHKMKRALQDACEAKTSLDSFAAEAVESSLHEASQLLAATSSENNEGTRVFVRALDDMRQCIEEAIHDDPSILRILSSERLRQCTSLDPCPAPKGVRASEVVTDWKKITSHSRSRPASVHTDLMSFFGSTEAYGSDASDSGQAQWFDSDDTSAIPQSIAVASLLIGETSRHAAFGKHLLNAHLETGRLQQTLHKWQQALRDMPSESRKGRSEFLQTANDALERLLKLLSERLWPSLRFLCARSCSVDRENPWSDAMTSLISTMAHFATLAHISREVDFSVLLSQRVRLINTDVKMIQLRTRCNQCRSINGAFKMRCCETHICPACMHEMMRSEMMREIGVARVCRACGSVMTGGKHLIVQANLLALIADCILQHARILRGPPSTHEHEIHRSSSEQRDYSASTRAGTSTEDVVASVINDALSGTHD